MHQGTQFRDFSPTFEMTGSQFERVYIELTLFMSYL